MKLKLVLFLCLSVVWVVAASKCPPPEFVAPCVCSDLTDDLELKCLGDQDYAAYFKKYEECVSGVKLLTVKVHSGATTTKTSSFGTRMKKTLENVINNL